ncbi:MAG TPA: sigma-E factor regulatory protein RseB domain-containing protein [Abditibacteriaceae bacterium]|nr:sigma-E factor regulatory protein RseB domain-containing protein [Abditibacteriaceae bacterium]
MPHIFPDKRQYQRAGSMIGMVLSISVLWPSHGTAAPAGEALLRAMVKAERTVQYSGVARVARQGAPVVVARVWRKGVQRRMEYSAPQIMRGDVLVDDGANVWRYHRADNSAVQTKTAARSRLGGMDIEKVGQAFKVKVLRAATTAGRPAWLVLITPRNGNRAGRKLWIDRATKALLRVEWPARLSQASGYFALQSVKFGPVAAARFRWSPPPQAHVTRTSGTLFMRLAQAQQAARSWLRFPHYSPRGYVFESAVIDSTKGEAWLRYTNGLSRFSIFQQRALNDGTKEVQKVQGAWYWQRGGSRFLLVGPAADEATKIAASVR